MSAHLWLEHLADRFDAAAVVLTAVVVGVVGALVVGTFS